MGRLKIKQEDGSKKRIAYLDEVQVLANDVDDAMDDIESLQTDKVDKAEGKQLSTNDYTNEEKQKNQDNTDDIIDLAGVGRTTETVKGNHDKIGVLEGIRVVKSATPPTNSLFWLDTTVE